MKVLKEVRFSREEVKALTHEAVRLAAIAAIGTQADGEEMKIDVPDYGVSVVTIETKENMEVNK